MSAKIICLKTYRRSRYFRQVAERMRRGEIRLPTGAEALKDLRYWRLVERGLKEK